MALSQRKITKSFIQRYEQRKKSAEIAIHQIELEMEDVLNRKSKGFVWLDYFTEHKNIEKLTREVVVSLIREIKVFDKTHIEVVFDFDDCYKECLNVIASQGHSVEVDSTGKLNIRLKEVVVVWQERAEKYAGCSCRAD